MTDEDTQSAPVTPNVVDPDTGDSHTFAIVSQPVNGSATIVNNQLVYTPDADYNGADSFTFRATDTGGLSVDGAAAVTVTAVNDAPTVTSASIMTGEDTQSVPVTPSVTDVDVADTYTFTILTQPENGQANMTGNQLVYTPDTNYSGTDNFTFRATDTGGLSVDGAAAVMVTAVNDAPLAAHAGVTALEITAGSPVSPYVDDLDVGDTFSYQIFTVPANGSASVVGNRLVYTPNGGFTNGTDSFSYRLTDSGGQTLDALALVNVFSNTSLGRCTSASVDNGDGTATRITAGPCAFYGEVVTRTTAGGFPVTVKYIALRPANGAASKATVFLIGGGDLDMNITGNPATGAVTTTGGNFVVRTAQLFAEAGYLAIAMNRPSDRPTAVPVDPIENIDQYRVSVDHAIDIVNVLRRVNTDNLDVFLSGTSRGAISAVANNLIVAGISISSAVTNDGGQPNRLFVGRPDHANLLPGFVQRPVHNLWHVGDGCIVSPPTGSQTLSNNLTAAGVTNAFNTASGGFNVTNPAPNPCGGMSFHGFLGIEPTAVGHVTAWLDGRMAALAGNKRPAAAFATVPTAGGTAKQIDLARLTGDMDGDALSYALPYATTSLGGSVILNGATVAYTPPAGVSNRTDYFVYIVTDGKGGVGAASIAVEIGG